MEWILNIAVSGIGGVVIVFLFRTWISERLKKSIEYEYSTKLESQRNDYSRDLESYKTDLNAKIQSIEHQNQMHQLRTSLFFDHQRESFAIIIETIDSICNEWVKDWDVENGSIWGVSSTSIDKYSEVISKHTLFLDNDSEYVVKSIRDILFKSRETGCAEDDYSTMKMFEENYHDIVYMKSRLADVFKEKIGVLPKNRAIIDVILLRSKSFFGKEVRNVSAEGIVEYAYSHIDALLSWLSKEISDAEQDKKEELSVTWYTLEMKQRYKYLSSYHKQDFAL